MLSRKSSEDSLGPAAEKRQKLEDSKDPSCRPPASDDESPPTELKGSNDDQPITPTMSFDLLPIEMLIKIFGYMDHGDRLCARQVNPRWRNAISNWPEFANSTTFVVASEPNSGSILKKSSTTWKKVMFDELELTSKYSLKMPDKVLSNVTTLELSQCTLPCICVMKEIVSLTAIEHLIISNCKLGRPKKYQVSKWTSRSQSLAEEWDSLTGRIKSLSLAANVPDIIVYLRIFSSLPSLQSFSIKEKEGSHPIPYSEAMELIEAILDLVSEDGGKIQDLSFQIESEPVLNVLFYKLIKTLSGYYLKLRSFVVNWESLLSYRTRDTDLQILRKFLRGQTKLETVGLPDFGPGDAVLQQKLLLDLPKTLKYLHIHDLRYQALKHLHKFPNAEYLEAHCDIIGHEDVFKKTNTRLKVLKIHQAIPEPNVPLVDLIRAFPTLVELELCTQCPHMCHMVDDISVQAICTNLKNLKSLTLGLCGKLTDFGVTGIQNLVCKSLYSTRTICMDLDVNIPDEERTGIPLSSLKYLTKLDIRGPAEITDVGIFYGFAFKDLRSIRLDKIKNITNWGYDRLATLNPNLEHVQIEVSHSDKIMATTLEATKRRLCRRKLSDRNFIKTVAAVAEGF